MLRQDLSEAALGDYRLNYRAIEPVKKKAKRAMDRLERSSHALKVWSRHEPLRFDDLPPPVPAFDPNAGYTTGMVAFASTPSSTISSTQSSEYGSPPSSELMDQSECASDTSYSSSPPGGVVLVEDIDLKPAIR